MSGTTAGPPVIEALQVVKKFGDVTAVDGVSFVVREGECCGFLGPNGAGKTTTVRMVSCVSPITSGEIRVFGLSVVIRTAYLGGKIVHDSPKLATPPSGTATSTAP